jgi:hypothetical protein
MMKTITAALAAITLCMPVKAAIDPNTDDLLLALESDGIEVAFNTASCKRRDIYGSYTFRPRTGWRLMTLCTGETVDAIDHSTVRHEAIHAIQHCANKRRGTSYNTPLLNDPVRFQQEVFANLYVSEIEGIQRHYEESDWEVEYEAFLYERTLTASQIMEWFQKVCGPAGIEYVADTGYGKL